MKGLDSTLGFIKAQAEKSQKVELIDRTRAKEILATMKSEADSLRKMGLTDTRTLGPQLAEADDFIEYLEMVTLAEDFDKVLQQVRKSLLARHQELLDKLATVKVYQTIRKYTIYEKLQAVSRFIQMILKG